MKIQELFIVFFLFVLSCSSPNADNKHNQILEKEKMAAIICDLTLMESELNIRSMQAPQKVDEQYKFNVFRQYNVSSVQYDSSLMYYSNHPAEFKKVYELVLEKLNSMQSETR